MFKIAFCYNINDCIEYIIKIEPKQKSSSVSDSNKYKS